MKKHKGLSKKIIISRIWLIIFTFFILFIFFQSMVLFFKKLTVWKKVDALKSEKELLLSHRMILENKNNLLNNSFGKEAILRERFNISKKGEEVIIITEPDIIENKDISKSNIFFRWIKSLF